MEKMSTQFKVYYAGFSLNLLCRTFTYKCPSHLCQMSWHNADQAYQHQINLTVFHGMQSFWNLTLGVTFPCWPFSQPFNRAALFHFPNVIKPNGSNSDSELSHFIGVLPCSKQFIHRFTAPLGYSLWCAGLWVYWDKSWWTSGPSKHPFLLALYMYLSFPVGMRACCMPVTGNHSWVPTFTLTTRIRRSTLQL